jgi:hypothetical protein
MSPNPSKDMEILSLWWKSYLGLLCTPVLSGHGYCEFL